MQTKLFARCLKFFYQSIQKKAEAFRRLFASGEGKCWRKEKDEKNSARNLNTLSRTLMHGSLSGKIKFRGYHRFRVNGSCYTFFLALKNGRIPFPPPSWSLSSQFGKIRHVRIRRLETIHVPPRNSSLGEGGEKGMHGTCIV